MPRTYQMPPCPSCQTLIQTPDIDLNLIIRMPVCTSCMDNFYSDNPRKEQLDATIDALADNLHDYINRIWPS